MYAFKWKTNPCITDTEQLRDLEQEIETVINVVMTLKGNLVSYSAFNEGINGTYVRMQGCASFTGDLFMFLENEIKVTLFDLQSALLMPISTSQSCNFHHRLLNTIYDDRSEESSYYNYYNTFRKISTRYGQDGLLILEAEEDNTEYMIEMDLNSFYINYENHDTQSFLFSIASSPQCKLCRLFLKVMSIII